METEPLRADRDDRGRGASDAGRLHGGEGEQHLCRLLLLCGRRMVRHESADLRVGLRPNPASAAYVANKVWVLHRKPAECDRRHAMQRDKLVNGVEQRGGVLLHIQQRTVGRALRSSDKGREKPSLFDIATMWEEPYMSTPDRTPLQIELADAIARSGSTRDHYDGLLQKALETTGKPLWDIERGKTRKPGPKTLRAIEKVLRYETDYLVDLVHPRDEVKPSEGLGRTPVQIADQPVVRSADAGETADIIRLDLSLPMGPGATVEDYVEHEPLRFDLAYIQSFTRTPMHRLRIAMGVGDSMFPTLVSNDLVWIDTTQNQLVHADRIYAASINGGAAIKRLRPVAGGARVLVISDNKTIDSYEVDANEVIIWGRVIRFARDL